MWIACIAVETEKSTIFVHIKAFSIGYVQTYAVLCWQLENFNPIEIFCCIVIVYFSYFMERGVCFLTLCEATFSKRQAFAYLEDLQQEFHSQFGSKVDTVARPYSFIEFGR